MVLKIHAVYRQAGSSTCTAMFGTEHIVYRALTVKKKSKVKFTLVQALRLCTGRTAHRGSTDIALLFHDHGTRRGSGVSVTPRPLYTPGKDPVPIVQEAGCAPHGQSGKVRKISPPTGIRSPDRPARSLSLYRLSYRAHTLTVKNRYLFLYQSPIGLLKQSTQCSL